MFPRGAYFGLAALIGPANLIDLHPSFSVSLSEKLAIGADYDIFWRYSRNDGLYGSNGLLIFRSININSKYIGGQAGFNLAYISNKFINFAAEITWFDAGSYLKAAGPGKDILFMGITTQVKF